MTRQILFNLSFRRLILLFGLLLPFTFCRPSSAANYNTAVFDPFFRTLKVGVPDNLMAPPVIRLNSDDTLVFSFDEITDEASHLQVRLVHCNADWQPSRLVESEYIDGFNIDDIEDYAFSQNTFIHFVNYRFEFPSERLRPTVSGNYLLQVFRQDNPEEVLLQARFMVTEQAVVVSGESSSRTDKGLNTEWQQVNLTIDPGDFQLTDPFSELTVKVSQNGRPDATRSIPRPYRLSGNKIIYEHIPALIFPAGNEFRRFETVRNNYPGMHVDSTVYESPCYHAYLSTDLPRADVSYSYDKTQHGRFVVREYNATDSDLGADYIVVHFELDHPEVINGDVYIDGELSMFAYGERNKMSYDRDTHKYRAQMPLKQGSYNYQYVVVPRGKDSEGNSSLIDGDKFETSNEYQTAVYFTPPGARYDRLIGFTTIYNK